MGRYAADPNFPLVGLFLQADPVVKAVMLLLALASVGVWTVVIDKAFRFGRLRREARALDLASRSQSLGPGSDGLASDVLRPGLAAREEAGDESRADRRDRLRETMRMVPLDGLRPLEPGLPFLATTGSAAPFVGLFGTVWGIMNGFASIANPNDTSLAVVAPGIAAALFSTAIGLAAAIPAVVAYNRLSRTWAAAARWLLQRSDGWPRGSARTDQTRYDGLLSNFHGNEAALGHRRG